MTKYYPTISVCIATYNSEKTLEECLKLVREQHYPQDKIEIILGDGGSTDSTFQIAKKYKARVVSIATEKQHPEYNRGVAFNAAKNELVLIIDHDNYLPYAGWLRDMIKPLVENPKIVASTTCYYHYDSTYKLMDRYFALFGTSEPLPYFLHKADRMNQTSKAWSLLGKAKDKGSYYLVSFEKDPRKIPSIGTNGTLMRRELIKNNARSDPDHHYPIDVMVDVIKKGHTKFAFVKNSIIHLTHARGLIPFLQRRKKFVEHYYFTDKSQRRWSVVMPGESAKVALFVLYSITFIGPTIESLKGFIQKPDIAWFVHPFMCLGTTLIYGYVTIKHSFLR